MGWSGPVGFVPSSGSIELPFQCSVCWEGLQSNVSVCVCVGFALQDLCCFPGFYFPGLGAQESFAVTLMSLYNFACDSLVTFPVKWSSLPKSLSAF